MLKICLKLEKMENRITNKYKDLVFVCNSIFHWISDIDHKHIRISKSEKIYPLVVHPCIISSNFVDYCMHISTLLRKL